MNFLFRFSKNFTKQKRNNFVVKRFIFSEDFLRIEKFRKEIEFQKQTSPNDLTQSKKKITDSVSKSKVDYFPSDISPLLFSSKTTDDVNLVINATKLLLKNKKIDEKNLKNLGLNIMKVLYILDKYEMGFRLLLDKELNALFKASLSKLIIMDKLFDRKKYEQVIDLFEIFAYEYKDPLFSKSKSDSNNFYRDQFELVSVALYNLNSREAIKKLRLILDKLEENNSFLDRKSIVRLFLLCINQNAPDLGLRLIHKYAFNIDLRLNLEIIALCRLGRISSAYLLADEIFNFISFENNERGKFFPLVIKSFQDTLHTEEGIDYSQKFKNLTEKISAFDRLAKIDLVEYCSIYIK